MSAPETQPNRMSKRTLRDLWVLSVLAIFACTLPTDYVHHLNLWRVSWRLFWDSEREGPTSRLDLFENALLFMPFGYFADRWLRAQRRREAPPMRAAAAVLAVAFAGAMLSTAIEALQTMSDTRIPSTSDILMNTIGALVGAIAASVFVE